MDGDLLEYDGKSEISNHGDLVKYGREYGFREEVRKIRGLFDEFLSGDVKPKHWLDEMRLDYETAAKDLRDKINTEHRKRNKS